MGGRIRRKKAFHRWTEEVSRVVPDPGRTGPSKQPFFPLGTANRRMLPNQLCFHVAFQVQVFRHDHCLDAAGQERLQVS